MATGGRLAPIDRMRGIVMILMASDHAAAAFFSGRLMTDSVYLYTPETALPALAFLSRWVSHICAPTFLFLAGTSLALSIAKRRARGVSQFAIDRDLLIRGLLIISVDMFLISWLWRPGAFLLQVMFAIGAAMILMIPMRRLPTGWLVAAALVVPIVNEFVMPTSFVGNGTPVDTAIRALLGSGMVGKVLVAYPILPWWSMLVLGWALGMRLSRVSDADADAVETSTVLAACGATGIGLYVMLRGANSFGNLDLLRLDDSWIQWLHVSKYPPSLTFIALELGLMALLLAGLFAWGRLAGPPRSDRGALLVFGQTAFFFYLFHILVLEAAARLLGMHRTAGLGTAWVATVAVVIVSYPACLAYRRIKARYPRSVLRYF